MWKFLEEDIDRETDPNEIMLKLENERVNQLADMALISFLKIMAGLKKSRKLLKYKENKGLCDRMKVPTYSVKLGFGLHVG